ncbi:MAG: glycerol-3-phosphate dehydrogenase/oxidase [Pseudomonadota bacterium]
MERNPKEIACNDYDLIVVGGGINGAAIAWEAVLRGLRVALFERSDFGWATSSNSAKIGHCGMRYLQHGDIKRLRESMRERNTLVQNAPHLVDSQPFIMPVHGHGVKGRETVGFYLRVYDWLSTAKKSFPDPGRRIADSGMLASPEVERIMPGVARNKLTGAGIWQEGQMHNTERLLMAYLRAAEAQGLKLANYASVDRLLQKDGNIVGVSVTDLTTGDCFEVSSSVVVNAAGPWVLKTLTSSELDASDYGIYASKAFSLLTRSFTDDTAFTFPIKPMYSDKKALIDKGSSMQFAIPWRDSTMVASLHLACTTEEPESIIVTEDEIDIYLEMINDGYPAAALTRNDIRNVLWGIIPAEEKGSAAPLKHYKIIDHSVEDSIRGLLTVVGVKYTTSRDIAEKTLDLAAGQFNSPVGKSRSSSTPLWGGDIDRIDTFMVDTVSKYKDRLPEPVTRRMARAYGTGISEVVALIEDAPELAEFVVDTDITRAEVLYAVRVEMAKSLADVVLRRTEMGSLDRPSDAALYDTANVIAQELGWDQSAIDAGVEEVKRFFNERPARLGVAA